MQYREQVDKLDCGICVIQLMHKYFYDKWISLSLLKSNVNYDENGINLQEISKLAKQFGIDTKILEGDFESFKKLEIHDPIILVIKNDEFLHYIIVEKILKTNQVIYFDPIKGKQRVSLDEFEEKYFNLIIICSRTKYDGSYEIQKEINLFKFNFIKEKTWITLSAIFLTLISFIGTFYLKIIIDQVIPSRLVDKIAIITILFILLSILKLVLSTIIKMINQKIDVKYQLIFLKQYIDKVSSVSWLKISHFDESTHLKNLEIVMKIASFKSNYIINWISQLFCLLLSVVWLMILDVQYFMISVIISLVTIVITFIFKKKFKSIEVEANATSMLFKKNYLNIINGIEQFKINTTKNYLAKKLEESLDKVVSTQIKASNHTLFYSLLQSLVRDISPFLIVILSVNQIWQNNLSLGELFMFLAVFNFFINPVSFFASALIEFNIINHYCDSINSFLNLKDEYPNNKLSENRIEKINQIKIENVDFKYGRNQNILKINELVINESTNIIGSNGAGKSTLLKIISTLIDDQEIYYNGKLIEYYNISSLRENICHITSEIYLPYGTVYDYLIADKKSNIEFLLSNIEKYKLLDLFEKMKLNLHTHIDDGGKNLSTGQRQFISIMKLFSNDYSLILLDEAFENIDHQILQNIFVLLRSYLEDKIVLEISHRSSYLFNKRKINCDEFK